MKTRTFIIEKNSSILFRFQSDQYKYSTSYFLRTRGYFTCSLRDSFNRRLSKWLVILLRDLRKQFCSAYTFTVRYIESIRPFNYLLSRWSVWLSNDSPRGLDTTRNDFVRGGFQRSNYSTGSLGRQLSGQHENLPTEIQSACDLLLFIVVVVVSPELQGIAGEAGCCLLRELAGDFDGHFILGGSWLRFHFCANHKLL